MDSKKQKRRPATRGETADPEVVLARLHWRCAEIKREELKRALCELDASGDLSERERVVLTEMADRIVAKLLGPPTAALGEAGHRDDLPVASLARLFDLEGDAGD